jgi:hypothetical protein
MILRDFLQFCQVLLWYCFYTVSETISILSFMKENVKILDLFRANNRVNKFWMILYF